MSVNVSSYTPPTLFNLRTGEITPHFENQLKISGIALKAHNSRLPATHIENVNAQLQENGCFQKKFELYKEGGVSNLKFTLKQAEEFLENDYKDRVNIIPRQTNILADAIVGSGIEQTMHRYFEAIKNALDCGSTFAAIHFIVKDEASIKKIEGMIKEHYHDVVKDIPINFVNANTDLDILSTGLNKIKNENSLKTNNYVMITSSTFVSKIEGIATAILTNKKSLGIASTSTRNWKKEMDDYGYIKALRNVEKATIAWASSAWNFKARQVHAELLIYKANQKAQKTRMALLVVVAIGLFTAFTNSYCTKKEDKLTKNI